MAQTSGNATVTMSAEAIHNPQEPRHFMRVKPTGSVIRIRRGDQLLAESHAATRLLEVGRDFYDPVVYFPARDIVATLRPNDETSFCPLKGHASYFDLLADSGECVVPNIAWSYCQPLPFASALEGLIAFYAAHTILEEHPLG